MVTYTDAELDSFETIFENAAWGIENEDQYFAFVLKMDPDSSIEQALSARNDAAEQVRRAGLTDQVRAAEDARTEQLVARGMAIVREIIARKKASA